MIHPNGHGHVADQADARPAAFIDCRSRILDRARIHSGQIINSTVGLDCRVYGATIRDSLVVGDEVVDATVIECGVFDQAAIWGNAYLYRAELTGGCRVYGDARIIGGDEPVKLWGDMRVVTGTFHRSPRYEHLGFCFLTESAPGHALVDCKLNSFAGWFRIGERFAKRYYDWTPEKLAEVRRVFTEWAETEDMRGKHWSNCISACSHFSGGVGSG